MILQILQIVKVMIFSTLSWSLGLPMWHSSFLPVTLSFFSSALSRFLVPLSLKLESDLVWWTLFLCWSLLASHRVLSLIRSFLFMSTIFKTARMTLGLVPVVSDFFPSWITLSISTSYFSSLQTSFTHVMSCVCHVSVSFMMLPFMNFYYNAAYRSGVFFFLQGPHSCINFLHSGSICALNSVSNLSSMFFTLSPIVSIFSIFSARLVLMSSVIAWLEPIVNPGFYVLYSGEILPLSVSLLWSHKFCRTSGVLVHPSSSVFYTCLGLLCVGVCVTGGHIIRKKR